MSWSPSTLVAGGHQPDSRAVQPAARCAVGRGPDSARPCGAATVTRSRAAVGATRAGRVVAYVLMGVGLLESSGRLRGRWRVDGVHRLVPIGRRPRRRGGRTTRRSLAGVSVADVMTADPHTAPGWISVEEFIQRYLLGDRQLGISGQGLVNLFEVQWE